uniref:Uncharacterized protein n=1 Tax=Lepeophtheirus salmonis TaxID=72036 RepID=A0A0K2U2J9_LEPSM
MSFSIPTMHQQCTSSHFGSCGLKINGNKMDLHSSVIHHHIMDMINDFWSSNLNSPEHSAHMATPKFLKRLINYSH